MRQHPVLQRTFPGVALVLVIARVGVKVGRSQSEGWREAGRCTAFTPWRCQRIIAGLLLWTVWSSTSVGAVPRPLDIPEAGLAMTLPEGWTAATEGTRYIVISPDGHVVMVLIVVEAGEVDAALARIKQNQQLLLSDVHTAGHSQYQHNGLAIVEEHGTATTTDGLSRWHLAVVTAARPVIVYTLTSPTALLIHQGEYAQVQRSFRRR